MNDDAILLKALRIIDERIGTVKHRLMFIAAVTEHISHRLTAVVHGLVGFRLA